MADIALEGWAELKPKLLDLPDKMITRILTASLRQGANVVKDEAKDRCPVLSGALRDSIRNYKARGTRDIVRFQVMAGNDAAYYALWVEKGHGGERASKNPHPFMQPALEASAGLATDFVMVGISDRLESLV